MYVPADKILAGKSPNRVVRQLLASKYCEMASGKCVIVCTDLSGKEPHRQVGVGRVGTSGSLGGIIVSTLSQNARDLGSIPTLGAIFPISITLTTLVAVTDPVQANML